MLRLVDIQHTGTDEDTGNRTLQVTLDRDGKTLQYEFLWLAPLSPDGLAGLDYSQQIVVDLLDYKYFPPPGQPHGVLHIPAGSAVCQAVYRAAGGGRRTANAMTSPWSSTSADNRPRRHLGKQALTPRGEAVGGALAAARSSRSMRSRAGTSGCVMPPRCRP